MSLLPSDGHVALLSTPEGDTCQVPLVFWRDDGNSVYGMILHRGALRRAEQVPGFRRYMAREPEFKPSDVAGEALRFAAAMG